MAIDETALMGPARFFAEVRDEDEGVVVSLAGELDLSTASTLREVFVLPEVLNSPAVQVDLTGLEFLDSCSIGILVAACRNIRNTGGAFSVRCEDGMARRVLQISGLVDFLEVEATSSRAPLSVGNRLASPPAG
jgi:anti-sigma B factor antagonist